MLNQGLHCGSPVLGFGGSKTTAETGDATEGGEKHLRESVGEPPAKKHKVDIQNAPASLAAIDAQMEAPPPPRQSMLAEATDKAKKSIGASHCITEEDKRRSTDMLGMVNSRAKEYLSSNAIHRQADGADNQKEALSATCGPR